MIETRDITGLVLAGGLGHRMGGADKGLQHHAGQPLALRALHRLRPQVGAIAINANRNLDAYSEFGVPVWADDTPNRPGPLAGILAGLRHCETPYLVSVPCDSPSFPIDLVARLARALDAGPYELAVATTVVDGVTTIEPVFCLMKTSLAEGVAAYLLSGGRKVEAWTALQRRALAVFDRADAFVNANTLEDLRRLPAPGPT